jgi:predicted hydrocarbon binding protein
LGFTVKAFLKEYIKNCNEFIGYANAPLLFRSGVEVAKALSEKSLEVLKKEIGLEFSHRISEGRVEVTVKDSLEARTKKSKKPMCHMLRGFFSEVFKSYVNGGEVVCRETRCRARGDDSCTFIIEVYSP